MNTLILFQYCRFLKHLDIRITEKDIGLREFLTYGQFESDTPLEGIYFIRKTISSLVRRRPNPT